ncbi:choice-of-anchor L domain-containing protein, partial [Winogradskyella sp.]|uniref:choice-of-anchor L domain-containing protein n=1 Tax=Winogradskyella sp. TaxID=1883156 RepID=UPI0025DB2617
MKKILYFLILIATSIGFAQDLSMQDGTFNRCAPDKFFDSGGEFGNYGNDEDFTITICPQNVDEFVILNFIQFSTQLNQDILTIYDGDDTSAPLLGTFSGTASPGTISSSPSNISTGCLTIAFISNGSGNTIGWEAEILCAAPCQDIIAIIDATVPAPNGTGVVGILPGESVDFSGSAIFSDDGTSATYDWDFGDLNTAMGTDVTNTFANPGTYTVTLTVTDDNPQGCTGMATITVFVLGPNVVVDQDLFTPQQLIEEVLVNSPCASVSNIIASTGVDFSLAEPNGIGYFFSNGIDFPFEDGILLTSGDASRSGGPNVFLGDGTAGVWPGDPDLNLATGINSNNATFIQFDFTPLADTISFDFLMASEEYDMGGFECTFSDAFAFLLTDSMGNTTNLAVLPGTNTPILVTNIHPDNGAACGAANPQYFGEYTPNNGPPISFDGRTTVFTAQSTVIPGENYTIKLVIADADDANFDSGVFLKAGSFDLGGDLGEDITIAAGTAECGGTPVTLDTGIPTASHVWYFEGIEISGETSSTIMVSDTGTYSVDVVFTGVCQSTDSVFVEFKASPSANLGQDLVGCSGSGSSEFILSVNDDDILGTQSAIDFVITYHLTEQDAIDNIGALPTNYTNVTNPQVIWARMADPTQTCFDTTSFSIAASIQPTINSASNLELCDDISSDGIEEFDLSIQTAIILGSQSATDFNVTYHLSFVDADSGMGALPSMYTNVTNPEPIFVRVESIGDSNCYNASATAVFNLVVNARDTAATPPNMVVCDDLSNDGIATFDLSTQESTILGTQDPLLFDVSFHASQVDADTNVGALATTYTNSTP